MTTGHSAFLQKVLVQNVCPCVFRTDNAVKNRWAALCKKDPQLERDHVLCTGTTSASKGARLRRVCVRRGLMVHRLSPWLQV